ncbi:MAG: single-stranded DNA-binding protein [Firmicutes bacterium]|nr:single-stranded DNA-binding protein [Bacillota bacterium]
MLNKIILIGRLTRDPELRFTPNGRAVCSFTLAVDRNFTSQDGSRETDFINIVVWGKQAETCSQYLAKGRLAAVDGRLQIRTFDGNDGQRKYMTEVVADNVQFLSPRESGNNAGAGYGNSGYGNAGGFGGSGMDSGFGGPADDNMPMTSDDLPF